MPAYLNEARVIAQDLGLDLNTVRFVWRDTRLVSGNSAAGLCIYWTIADRVEIYIATQRSHFAVLITLAHELRHAWQYQTGTLKAEGGTTVWSGAQWCPETTSFKKLKYNKRPQEIDANGYADEAIPRLFPGTNIRMTQPKRGRKNIEALFLDVRYD